MREKLEEADGMLKGLDDCIQELETGNETLEEIHLPLVQHSPPFKPNVVINVNLLIVASQNLQQLKGAVPQDWRMSQWSWLMRKVLTIP